MKTRPGRVVWITGLSGAGKSTVAALVHARLKRARPGTVLLDGDAVRQVCGNDLGYDRPHRLENAHRISRLCRLLSSQGIDVVCATMSLFKECHAWNRRNLPRYLEVYLRVPLAELKRRDPKGLYRRAADPGPVVGVHMGFDEPAAPDLVVDNAPPMTPRAAARAVLKAAGIPA
ncbi:MAG: adenylyl-sulfate kinase [Elusimicrobia bacterium]|nr:adenylyl-sulfate kinase [Elusimicrobiota bacterium]